MTRGRAAPAAAVVKARTSDNRADMGRGGIGDDEDDADAAVVGNVAVDCGCCCCPTKTIMRRKMRGLTPATHTTPKSRANGESRDDNSGNSLVKTAARSSNHRTVEANTGCSVVISILSSFCFFLLLSLLRLFCLAGPDEEKQQFRRATEYCKCGRRVA